MDSVVPYSIYRRSSRQLTSCEPSVCIRVDPSYDGSKGFCFSPTASITIASNMRVRILTLTKHSVFLNVDSSASVDELKARLSQDTGIPLAGQRLVFKGQELLTGTVAENGIMEGDFLVVVVVQLSGVKKSDTKSTNSKVSPLQRREETTNFQDQSSNPTHQFHENRQGSRHLDVDVDEDAVDNNDEIEEGIDDEVDPDSLQQLMDMGFPANRANKALIITRGNTQLAMDWLLEHERDPDIDEPLTLEQIDRIHAGEDEEYGEGEGEDGIMMIDPQEAAQRLMELGFTEEDIAYALEATGHDFEAAAAWLLGDYFPPPPPPPPLGHVNQEPPYHGEDPDDDGDDDDDEDGAPLLARRHDAGAGHR